MVPVKLSNSLLLAKETQTTITDWGSTVLRVWSLQRSGLGSAEAGWLCKSICFCLNGLSILSLTGGNYHILNWLYVLLNNRKFRIGGAVARQAKQYIDEHFAVEYKQYDVIKGYRADDSYFSFASAFLNNTISLQQLEKAMLLGKLGEQIVAISGKAFARFTFEEAIPAPCDMYYPKKLARDSKAREDFAKEKDRETVLSEKYVLDIIREEWGNEDERLQRIILG